MKCGNCKQDHPTVAAVKSCYAKASGELRSFDELSTQDANRDAYQEQLLPERTPVPAQYTQDIRYPTERQSKYLSHLVSEREWPVAGKSEAEARNIATCENVLEGKAITFDEAKAAISFLLVQPKREAPAQRSDEQQRSDNVITVGCVPGEGTYTVVLGSERRTLKFVAPKEGTFKGKIVVRYLSGSDNESDYTGFANSQDVTHVRIWRRYKEDSVLVEALKFLCESDANRADAGERYALESSRCWRCGRKLTVPASIHRGLGPECAKRV